MSDITTPFDVAVEMQRESIKHTQGLLQQGLELQQNAFEAFMYNGISAQRSAQRQAVDLFQGLFNAQLDAVESSLDDDEFRSTLDRQFQQNAEMTQELMNASFEQGAELTQELFNGQLDALESALDDEAFREALDSQFDDFERTQQRAWNKFESEFGQTFDELSERQQELVVETALTARREPHDDTVEGVRAAETVTENTSDEAEAVAETTQEALSNDVRTTANGGHHGDAHSERLESIDGLGEAYADRLRGSGIQSVDHLAEADTATVAEAAEVSEDHADEWVTSAQAQA
ncbi:helix-hairpin-helix domain-containing protein [Haloarcula salinisoli]|uniref:Helix-hairpin-helix domain-containing protein n=1 Tax=Haloarcula salinisoli TaxID=2487746 RepID=A0A8J7YIQ9_9EURY|nr:helix-hairpin-helix domain-containing protein [Halomicroarcula salinisoli]MBX0302616.1 helix-hairpin-helix domain-containing protein [Halomicroarcula salinisoli]